MIRGDKGQMKFEIYRKTCRDERVVEEKLVFKR